jgi:transglutaminase-like putative cysteine protease
MASSTCFVLSLLSVIGNVIVSLSVGNTLRMRRFLLAIVLVGASVTFLVGASELQDEKRQLPTEQNPPLPYVFEVLQTRYRFENDGTGTKEVNARIRILTLTGTQQFPELTFQYKPSRERLRVLYVHILRHDGKVVDVETDPPPNPRRIFREGGSSGFDLYEKSLPLPSASPGDALEYDVETESYAAETPGNFSEVYRFSPEGVLDEELEIDVPNDRAIKLKTKPGLQNSSKAANGRRIYSWEVVHQASDFENRHGAITISDGIPDVQVSSFRSWEEVGRWYEEMEATRHVFSPEVKAKAEELTAGLKTDPEKVAVLYDFVSQQIKYLSLISFGIGGYEPRTARDVLRLGYGDCKDKDTLLAALLEAEGMHASSVLINPTRQLDPELPSPWPFTHVITVLNLGKHEIWMDSSGGVPFRILPPVLQKKKALVIPPAGTPHFEETPATQEPPRK